MCQVGLWAVLSATHLCPLMAPNQQMPEVSVQRMDVCFAAEPNTAAAPKPFQTVFSPASPICVCWGPVSRAQCHLGRMLTAQIVPTGACIPFMALITEESFPSVLGECWGGSAHAWMCPIRDCCEVCPCALLTTAGAAESTWLGSWSLFQLWFWL